jgi:heme-degrading monooxygenase HmoA
MIAVIFEVRPRANREGDYLALAAQMRSLAEAVEGFISVERFQSLADPRKILSLSFFEDEAAVTHWRSLGAHRIAQAKGREQLFDDYRLRVCDVLRDYGLFDRTQAPNDSRRMHGP